MLKNLLLLLLCVPLAYVGFVEGRRLYGPPPAATAATPADLSSADFALRAAHAKGAEYNGLRPEVRASVLRLDDELPKGTEPRKPFDELIPALQAQANNYWDVRLFMRQYGTLTADESVSGLDFRGTSKEQFQNWVKSRRALLQLEREMENLAADLPDKAETLRKRVEDYRLKPFHSEGRANGYLARIERIELERKRDEIARDYERGLTGDRNVRGRVRGDVTDYLKRVKAYAENERYKDVNEEDRWARKQQIEWEARLKLLDLSNSAAAASDEKFAGQIKALAGLLADMELPGDFRRLVRETAARCCEAYLPKKIDLDTNVLARGKKVPRSKISVTWLADGKTEPLNSTPYNEKTIPFAQVNQFYDLVNGNTVVTDELKPTPKTEAAIAYNDSRKKLQRWNPASVKQLYDDCAKYQGDLEVWGSVEELQKLVKDYPDLFGGA